jgi:hypothetical protein
VPPSLRSSVNLSLCHSIPPFNSPFGASSTAVLLNAPPKQTCCKHYAPSYTPIKAFNPLNLWGPTQVQLYCHMPKTQKYGQHHECPSYIPVKVFNRLKPFGVSSTALLLHAQNTNMLPRPCPDRLLGDVDAPCFCVRLVSHKIGNGGLEGWRAGGLVDGWLRREGRRRVYVGGVGRQTNKA